MSRVITSRNLFIDTSTVDQPGDNITLPLGQDGITCQTGQMIKLSLSYFCMYRDYYKININNSKVRLFTDSTLTMTNDEAEIVIPFGNYTNFNSIVLQFAEAVKTRAVADSKKIPGSKVTQAQIGVLLQGVTFSQGTVYPTESGFNGTTNLETRIMKFTIQFKDDADNNQAHKFNTFALGCHTDIGESYEIFGGNRINDPSDRTTPSFLIDTSDVTQITVTGFYPMQMSTDSHMCVRCGLQNTNLSTPSFEGQVGVGNTQMSQILALIPVDNDFTSYADNGNDQFFLYATTPSLSSLRVYLTDHKNRPLGRNSSTAGSLTSGGTGLTQSTLGNLSFRAVIRIDILQNSVPPQLETKPTPVTIPPRFTGLLNNLPTQ